ncbi:urea transporter [Stutzerimonas frequens]|uniref:urea transporter n=1 Tax=Stutzerimonas frequens TaxID=2968969 RepID=UPI003F53E0FC
MDAPNLGAATSDGSAHAVHRFSTPLVSILGPALGGAFLIPHPWIGALLWLGLFENLRFAAFALFGTVLAEGILRLFQIRDHSPAEGNLKANALLAAIAAAWLTEYSGLAVEAQILVVACTVSATTILATATLRPLLRAGLPPLVVSYCMVSVFLFAIFPHWTLSAMASMQWWPVPETLQQWLVTYFRTLGALLFSPTLGIGMIIALAVLLWSRLAFFAGTLGWIAGIVTAVQLNQLGVVFYWMPTAYNSFLAGAALGCDLSGSQPHQPAPGSTRWRLGSAAGRGLSASFALYRDRLSAARLGADDLGRAKRAGYDRKLSRAPQPNHGAVARSRMAAVGLLVTAQRQRPVPDRAAVRQVTHRAG